MDNLGTHRPRDASSKRRNVQGTHHPKDTSSKGCILQELLLGDTLFGDELALHRNGGEVIILTTALLVLDYKYTPLCIKLCSKRISPLSNAKEIFRADVSFSGGFTCINSAQVVYVARPDYSASWHFNLHTSVSK